MNASIIFVLGTRISSSSVLFSSSMCVCVFFSSFSSLCALKIACTWNVCIVRFELNRWQAPSICYAIKQSIASYCRFKHSSATTLTKMMTTWWQLERSKVCQTLQYATSTMFIPMFARLRFIFVLYEDQVLVAISCCWCCCCCCSSMLLCVFSSSAAVLATL